MRRDGSPAVGEDGSSAIRLSETPGEKQDNDDDEDDAQNTDAPVTEAVTVAPKAAAEATEQENDDDDNEDGSERHDLSPLAAPNRVLNLSGRRL